MMDLDEYREKLSKDPKSRRALKKLEKEYERVKAKLTPEEEEKYGLNGSGKNNSSDDETDAESREKTDSGAASKADSVIDLLSKK